MSTTGSGSRIRSLQDLYSLRAVLAPLRAACSDFSNPARTCRRARASRHK